MYGVGCPVTHTHTHTLYTYIRTIYILTGIQILWRRVSVTIRIDISGWTNGIEYSSTVIQLCACVCVRACVANQATAADKEGQAQRRMKEVVTRRRLLELARAQTDEVRALPLFR